MDQYYVIANTLIIVSIIIIAFIITYFVAEKFHNYKYEIAEKDKQIIVLKKKLQDEIQLRTKLNENHLKKLNDLESRIKNTTDTAMHIVTSEFYDILLYYDLLDKKVSNEEKSIDNKITKSTFKYALSCKYKFEYLIYLFPELCDLFQETNKLNEFKCYIQNSDERVRNLFEVIDLLEKNYSLTKSHILFVESAKSNLTAIPYMAKIMADYETYGLEFLAKKLEWGYSQERAKKVKSIREIRRDAQAMVEKKQRSSIPVSIFIKSVSGS